MIRRVMRQNPQGELKTVKKIVLIFNPNCIHCQNMRPKWEEIKKTLTQEVEEYDTLKDADKIPEELNRQTVSIPSFYEIGHNNNIVNKTHNLDELKSLKPPSNKPSKKSSKKSSKKHSKKSSKKSSKKPSKKPSKKSSKK